ncbi:metallophosphoesterase [Gemmata sp.]|uniref:metallophosphoesterase n=1 Tax=Gemmata sp. TaxID=1914242 RepID=UPI003F7209F1
MKRLILALLAAPLGVALLGPAGAAPSEEAGVTFIVTSDSHYVSSKNLERIDRNKVTIERMNAIPGTAWPDKLGGGKVGTPRGVLALGDLIDDGDKRDETPVQWRHFEKQFGLDGTDGLLKYPVFEGWGNHDGPPVGKEKFGFSVQAKIKERTVARKKAGRIGNVSENGLHYSWDWDKVHFVQTNLYPADTQHAKVRYSLPWHDPQGALAFVKDDLKASVGDSGRPVIIVSHCGVDTDWWHPEDWAAFYAAVKPYNVIAYFYGHTGTGPRRYKPEGEDRVLDCVNTGQSEKGSVVAEVTEKRLRLAFHAKKDAKAEQVEWEWKYPLDKPVTAGK